MEYWIRLSPAGALVNGGAAVTLFFVLSGFVLTLPYKRGRSAGYGIYLLKRFCRIYLPYAASLFLVLAVMKLVREPVYIGVPQFDRPWNSGTDWHLVAKHLTGIGNFDFNAYDPPYWTLTLEMRMSLVMPVIAYLALRSRFIYGLLAAIAVSVAVWIATPHFSHGLVLQVLMLGCQFYLGGLLAANFESMAAWFRSLNAWIRRLMLLLSLCLYAESGYRNISIPPINSILMCCACLVLLLGASESLSIRHFLHRPFVLRLGQLSYSLYLVHMIVLLATVHMVWGRMPIWPLIPVMWVGAYLLAEAFHWAVEIPTMRLGRSLERRFSPRPELTVGRVAAAGGAGHSGH